MTSVLPLWIWSTLLIVFTVSGSVFVHSVLIRKLPNSMLRKHHDVAAAIYAIVGILHGLILGFLLVTSQERLETVRHSSMKEATLLVELVKVAEGLSDASTNDIKMETVAYVKSVIGPEWAQLRKKGHLGDLPSPLKGMFSTMANVNPQTFQEQNIHAECLTILTSITLFREQRLHASSEHLHGLFVTLIIVGALCMIGGVMVFTHDSKVVLLGFTAAVSLTVVLVVILIIVLDSPIANGLLTPDPYEHALYILNRPN